MQLDDPFPVEHLPDQLSQAVLEEFQGHRPTIREVACIPDAEWLKCPSIGPARLAQLRSVTKGVSGQVEPSPLARWTDARLLERHRGLVAQRNRLRRELERLRNELRTIEVEFLTREIDRSAKRPARERARAAPSDAKSAISGLSH